MTRPGQVDGAGAPPLGAARGDVVGLATAVARLLDGAGLTAQAEALSSLARATSGRSTPGRPPPPGARRPPVLAHLPAALDGVGDGVGAVAAVLRAVAPAAAWTRTASYLHDPPEPGFADRYAHATLLGPPDGEDGDVPHIRGAPSRDECALGLLLLAPGTHYPPHRHPADEVYLPLAPAHWLDPDGAYRPAAAGAVRRHGPWQPHAMRTGALPLLAAYVWTGDVRTPSRFCAAPSASPA